MDVYTTSFTYPRRPRHQVHSHNHSPSASLEYTAASGGGAAAAADFHSHSHSHAHANGHESSTAAAAAASSAADGEAIQKLAMVAMSLHGCHVSYFLADQGGGWNFHVTGAYQQVMAARGMILKECPIQVRFY
jgi:hypothetical protein